MRFTEKLAKFLVVENKEVPQFVFEYFFAGVEAEVTACFRKTVPWTGIQAVITAVESVADQGAQLQGNGALVLDRQVGDAAWSVHEMRPRDRVGGAGVQTGGACSAVVLVDRIRGERKGRDEFSKEEPGAELAVDLDGGFSLTSSSEGVIGFF